MQRRNKIALSVFALFYVGFGVFITINQEAIIYQPWSQDFESCRAFSNAKKVIHNGTRMYVLDGKNGVVVFYHGNAGSACDRGFYANIFKNAGYGYIIPEYAGYSNDPIAPSHERIKKDVENVIAFLNRKTLKNVIVMGESIGTGVASYHASLQHPSKVLLISPFYSLADIAKNRFWFYPSDLLVNDAFNNRQLLESYTGHITIIHGTEDAIIAYSSGKKLFDSLSSRDKIFKSIDGYGHNNLFETQKTHFIINEFLEL